MVSMDTFRKLALSFPEAKEDAHFEKVSFKIKNKIFATYDGTNNRACVKLSVMDQDVFSTADKKNIFPAQNKWGKQGWTIIEMKNIHKAIFIDALTTAYCEAAPKKLANQLRAD